MKHILWVDDELDILQAESRYLGENEIAADMVSQCGQAVQLAETGHYDCIILDVLLGKSCGFDLCGKLKQVTDTPIIFFSNLTEDEQQQQGFICGGDDYITKGCSKELFLLKVNACIRRNHANKKELILKYPPLEIDLLGRRVAIDGKEVIMTAQLFDIFVYLVQKEGEICTLKEIYREIWQQEEISQLQFVQVQISRLRRKLDEAFPRHAFIETVWGKGYYFQSYKTFEPKR